MLLDIAAKSAMQGNGPAEAPPSGGPSGGAKMTPEQMLEDAKKKKAKGG